MGRRLLFGTVAAIALLCTVVGAQAPVGGVGRECLTLLSPPLGEGMNLAVTVESDPWPDGFHRRGREPRPRWEGEWEGRTADLHFSLTFRDQDDPSAPGDEGDGGAVDGVGDAGPRLVVETSRDPDDPSIVYQTFRLEWDGPDEAGGPGGSLLGHRSHFEPADC